MWPGQRDPRCHDAAYAHETPQPSFLHAFKDLLLRDYSHTSGNRAPGLHPPLLGTSSSEHSSARVSSDRADRDEREPTSGSTQLSFYPLLLLQDLPSFPSSLATSQLSAIFATSFRDQFYFHSLIAIESKAPYLAYARACLGAVIHAREPLIATSSGGDDPIQGPATDYFWAGSRLLTLILELDNREARKIEVLIAGALLETYGILTSDPKVWRAVNQFHGCLETIARRLRLHETPFPAKDDHNDDAQSSATHLHRIMSHLFLLDSMRAIHLNRTPSYSATELHMPLPSGTHGFQDAYLSLKCGQFNNLAVSSENALLLLSAILSDTIVYTRVFYGANCSTYWGALPRIGQQNDYLTPFSPSREARKVRSNMSLALDHWFDYFGSAVPSDIRALYFFCRLLLVCPQTLQLPRLAQYACPSEDPHHPQPPDPLGAVCFDIPEEALKVSWLLLEQVDVKANKAVASVWLPIILFHAALVVGAKLLASPPEAAGKNGILRSLTLFKMELEHMPWPCCEAMISTIDKVMGL